MPVHPIGGLGDGDVVGPVSSLQNGIVSFSDNTGESIESRSTLVVGSGLYSNTIYATGGNQLQILGTDPDGISQSGIFILAGTSGSMAAEGGNGSGNSDGGTIVLLAGDGDPDGGTGRGGGAFLQSGNGGGTSGAGGTLVIISGSGTGSDEGGLISITAGNGGATGVGGSVSISAGSAGGGNNNGGNITFIPGASTGSGIAGVVDCQSDLKLSVAGSSINYNMGANGAAGTATLLNGTVTVNTTAVTANSKIKLTRQSIGTTGAAPIGIPSLGTVIAGTSFVINALNPANGTAPIPTDQSIIYWEISDSI